MDKNIAVSIIEEEIDRLSRLIKVLEKELSELPKGSIQYDKAKRTDKKYAKLFYRENGKVVCRYIGSERKVNELNEKLNQSKELKLRIQVTKQRMSEIKKLVKMK